MKEKAGKFANIKIFMMLFIKTHHKQNKRLMITVCYKKMYLIYKELL